MNDGKPLFSNVHKAFDPWWKRWVKSVWFFFFRPRFNQNNLEVAIGVDTAIGESENSVTLVRKNKFTGVMYVEDVQNIQDRYFEQMKSLLRLSHKPIYITKTPYPSPFYGKSMLDVLKQTDREFRVRVMGDFDFDDRTDNCGFMECDSCSGKVGAPQLCASCIHNRNLIHALRSKLQ